MQVRIDKTTGLRNELLLVLSRSEVDEVLFHIAHRDRLRELPGLLRHVSEQDLNERRQVNECKISVEQHLRLLSISGHHLFDDDGPNRRLIVIGSRNVGNNHGFIAWQKSENPKLFRVSGDPLNYPSYSCLVRDQDGQLSIRSLRFAEDRVLENSTDITDEIAWCVYANWVLRQGRIVNVESIIEQFYDIRHVLAFDREHQLGRQIESEIYKDYPERFRENSLRLLRQGVPRNRYLHNCLGLSDDHIFILQREGTIEEVAQYLKKAGARDGIILDNGASVFSWAWWPYPKGGFLFTAPDYRPLASAVIAFVLDGPAKLDLPGGSTSFSVV
jgi:hypothetical protein